MTIITTELLKTFAWILGIIGVGAMYRGTIGSVIKATLSITIKDHVERERSIKVEYQETRVMVKAELEQEYDLLPKKHAKYKDAVAIAAVPATISEIDKLKAEIFALQNDVVLWLPMFNKNLEGFREEMEKLVEEGKCSPELRDKCIDHFLQISKAINGGIGE